MNCAFTCIYLLFAYMPLSFSYNLVHVSSCQHASSNTYWPAEGDGMIPLAFSPLYGARALWNECVARTRRSVWYTILMSGMTGWVGVNWWPQRLVENQNQRYKSLSHLPLPPTSTFLRTRRRRPPWRWPPSELGTVLRPSRTQCVARAGHADGCHWTLHRAIVQCFADTDRIVCPRGLPANDKQFLIYSVDIYIYDL